MFSLARAVRTATGVAIVLLVAGIVIHLLGANTSNGIVSAVNDAAKWLAQPFHNVFRIHSHKANIGVNWGLAAVVYAVVGAVIATLLVRTGVGGRMRRRAWGRNPAL